MILQKRYKIEIQIPTDSLRKKLFCKDIIVGALDKCKYSLISSSWAASFYGKGQQTACIQCLGAYATTQSSYKNYNTAIKSELSQAIPTANSSWAANAPLDTVLYSASKLLFFQILSNWSNETGSAMCSEGHQFQARAPPKFNRALVTLPE